MQDLEELKKDIEHSKTYSGKDYFCMHFDDIDSLIAHCESSEKGLKIKEIQNIESKIQVDDWKYLAGMLEADLAKALKEIHELKERNEVKNDALLDAEAREIKLESALKGMAITLARYSMSAGEADQRMCESRCVREELGFDPNADDISPSDIVEAIQKIREDGLPLLG